MIALTNPSTDKKGKWTKLQKEERYKMAPDRIIIFWDNIIFWQVPPGTPYTSVLNLITKKRDNLI